MHVCTCTYIQILAVIRVRFRICTHANVRGLCLAGRWMIPDAGLGSSYKLYGPKLKTSETSKKPQKSCRTRKKPFTVEASSRLVQGR